MHASDVASAPWARKLGLKTKSADANKDGAMRVSEVREYVLQKVLALTNGAQRPTTRQDNLDFDYVVY